jgi:hypothetical protein
MTRQENMKSANLEAVLDDLDTSRGSIYLPPNRSEYSARMIAHLIECQLPKEALSLRTIQRAIADIGAPPIKWVSNTPYYDRLYAKAALLYLKFKVEDDN